MLSLESKGCRSCNAGNPGGSCSPDIEKSHECVMLMEVSCRMNGVNNKAEEVAAKGCSTCPDLRTICATTCNYCDIAPGIKDGKIYFQCLVIFFESFKVADNCFCFFNPWINSWQLRVHTI